MTLNHVEKNTNGRTPFKHILFVPDYMVSGNLDTALRALDFELTKAGFLTEDMNDVPMHYDPGTSTFDYNIPGMARSDVDDVVITSDFISRQLGLPAYGNSSAYATRIRNVQIALNKVLTADEINNVLLSKDKKPYEVYTFESSMVVLLHEGFFNMLLSAHKEFRVLVLSDLVNEFGKNYGLEKLHKSILFNVFSLYV